MTRTKLQVTERLLIRNASVGKLIGGVIPNRDTGKLQFVPRPSHKLTDEEETQVCFIVDELNRNWEVD